jgi:hypothetical protein
MVDEPSQAAGPEVDEPNQGAPGGAPSQGESPLRVESEGDIFSDKPEIFVGAAFVGGFALAQILKRFGS